MNGHPPSANHSCQVYDRWFSLADGDGDGRVTGQDAVIFFARSGLPKESLARVWELANTTKQGFLDRNTFHKAMDLIAMGQAGVAVTKDNYELAKVGRRTWTEWHDH